MPQVGYIIAKVEFKQQEGKWLGRCPDLGTSTYADSLQEARDALREMILLQLNALEQAGERARFFRKHHIRLYRQKPTRRSLSVDLPIDDNLLTQTTLVPVPC